MLQSDLKYKCGLALAVCFLQLQLGFSFAAPAPPPNDLCAGAEVIPGAGPFPYLSLRIPDISSATTNGDPVLPSSPPECHQTVSRGIWYEFTPAASGFYNFTVNDTATTVADTLMALYTSAGGCAGPFSLLACNDDAGFLQSAIATNLIANNTYYCIVWKLFTNAPTAGQTAVQLKVSQPRVPANDICTGAEIIPASGPFPYFTAVTDTLLAATVSDPPDPTCQVPGFRSVWYRFAPASGGTYIFTTVSNTATRVFDTLLSVYSSSGCGGPFTPVACNDDTGSDLRSTVSASLAAGGSYYIVVWDMEGADPGYNAVQLAVWRSEAPKVATLPATAISLSTVIFNGFVTPNSANEFTRTWFDWGPTANYGTSTAALLISSNLVNVPVSRSILVNPVSDIFYHYRAVAGHSKGTNYGADQTFCWTGAQPNISSINPLANGPYRLHITGNPGQIYKVERSQSLTNWLDAGAVSDLGSGSFEFIDFDALLYQNDFYRVRTP